MYITSLRHFLGLVAADLSCPLEFKYAIMSSLISCPHVFMDKFEVCLFYIFNIENLILLVIEQTHTMCYVFVIMKL